jgi:V/A-type H+-transporting ATPase subunit I
MINGIKIRDLKTVFDSISWFLIQFSIISGVMVIFGFFEISKTFLLIPLILGFGIRLFIRNLFGLMDIPGFFGNLLSYSRLMIIVLTSTYIAFIINLGTQMLWKNYIPLAIGIFVIGHAFNFLLGVLGAGINSLRLHYIEFFGRFFESKGMEYKPFRKILSVEVI